MESIRTTMSGCTQTDKPRIAILMAVYEPRMDWLREQLCSLNAQTYPNLMLYVRDDCSPMVPYEEIQSCLQECISAFPYVVQRNEKNLGSNRTFERLTQEAEGDYFAYCDQDDVWLPEKLEILERAMSESGALLSCSDMYIIDGKGAQIADSITKVRKHHVFHSGKELAAGLLTHNFVTGCTMLLQAKLGKRAVPFCPYMVHDHYLALWCAEQGAIISVEKPLIRYRIHGGNQTGLLAGVYDKASYGRVRIDAAYCRMAWLKENFPCCAKMKKEIEARLCWLEARQRNWNHRGGAMLVWRYRKFSQLPSLFEIVACHMPEWLFCKFVELGKRNLV